RRWADDDAADEWRSARLGVEWPYGFWSLEGPLFHLIGDRALKRQRIVEVAWVERFPEPDNRHRAPTSVHDRDDEGVQVLRELGRPIRESQRAAKERGRRVADDVEC